MLNPEIRKKAETLARYVVKNGPSFETNVIEKHKGDPKACTHGALRFPFPWREGGDWLGPFSPRRWRLRASMATEAKTPT